MKADELFPPRAERPGLHALVVGVSEYGYLLSGDDPREAPAHHFGLRKLTSAARAAFRVYRWLVDRANHLAVPLASSRLLLSPSAAEQPELSDWAPAANLSNFETAASAWRHE